MQKFYIRRPEMFNESAKGNAKGIIRTVLTFFVVFLIISLASGIIPIVWAVIEGIKMAAGSNAEVAPNELTPLILSLFCTIIPLIGVIIYCVCIEHRSLASMGIKKEYAARDYLVGCLIGLIMFSAVVLVNVLLGGMKFDGLNSNASIGLLLVFFAGFIVQGMSEEFVFRGYLMNTLGGKHSMSAAVIISSLAFMAAHLGNDGLNVLALVNLFLVAVFFALYMICFDNIWGACAIHSVWNYSQGNIYGIKVSGIEVHAASVFSVTSPQESSLVNGGAFGAEGGLGTTVVLLVSLALLIVYMIKTGKAGYDEKSLHLTDCQQQNGQ